MSYRLDFFDKVIVNHQVVDEQIDDESETVRLRSGLTDREIFEAGRRFGIHQSNRILDVNRDDELLDTSGALGAGDDGTE